MLCSWLNLWILHYIIKGALWFAVLFLIQQFYLLVTCLLLVALIVQLWPQNGGFMRCPICLFVCSFVFRQALKRILVGHWCDWPSSDGHLHRWVVAIWLLLTDIIHNVCYWCFVAAAKLNASTKEINKKHMGRELMTWFANARDRGAGGRKAGHRRHVADMSDNDVEH